jgi:hypothetical protein
VIAADSGAGMPLGWTPVTATLSDLDVSGVTINGLCGHGLRGDPYGVCDRKNMDRGGEAMNMAWPTIRGILQDVWRAVQLATSSDRRTARTCILMIIFMIAVACITVVAR